MSPASPAALMSRPVPRLSLQDVDVIALRANIEADAAAIQDAHSIYGELADTASTVTGVHLREISLDPLIQMEPSGQDPQFVLQLILLAHVECDV
jgi:hypothetical protein